MFLIDFAYLQLKFFLVYPIGIKCPFGKWGKISEMFFCKLDYPVSWTPPCHWNVQPRAREKKTKKRKRRRSHSKVLFRLHFLNLATIAITIARTYE